MKNKIFPSKNLLIILIISSFFFILSCENVEDNPVPNVNEIIQEDAIEEATCNLELINATDKAKIAAKANYSIYDVNAAGFPARKKQIYDIAQAYYKVNAINPTIKNKMLSMCQSDPKKFGYILLAIAMQETDDLVAIPDAASCDASAYPFGDKYPQRNGICYNKIGDDANFGIYKMNWGMIRNTNKLKTWINSLPLSATVRSGIFGKPLGYNTVVNFRGVNRKVGDHINYNNDLATSIILDAMFLHWSVAFPGACSDPNEKTREPKGVSKQRGISGNFWAGHRQGPGTSTTPVVAGFKIGTGFKGISHIPYIEGSCGTGWRDIQYYQYKVFSSYKIISTTPNILTNKTRIAPITCAI